MRILVIAPLYWPDSSGATRLLQGYAESLAAKGHKVKVWTTDAAENRYLYFPDAKRITSKHETRAGVEIFRFPVWHPSDKEKVFSKWRKLPFPGSGEIFDEPRVVSLGLQMASRLRPGRFDLVLAGYLPFTSFLHAGAIVAGRSKCPLVYLSLLHFGELGDDALLATFGRLRQRRLLLNADLLLANTEVEMIALMRWGVPERKIAIVGAGIDPLLLRGGVASRFRREYGLEHPIVFQISAQTHDKGSHHIVEAMKQVWARGIESHVVLSGKVLPDFDEYLACQEKSILERVICVGHISEQHKKDLLAAGDVMVMLSRAESFGIAYLEAWFYGKPVVGCYAGSLPALIRDGSDGYLVPFADVHMLAETIAQLLTREDLRKRIGDAGHEKVVSSYLWEHRLRLLERALSRITDGEIG